MNDEQKSKIVLMFEQDTKTLSQFQIVFEKLGYVIEEAGMDLAELDDVVDFTPDMIIADTGNPDISAFEILDKVRQRNPNIPVILTGNGDSASIIRAFRSGANDFIRKPLNPKEIESRVTTIVNDVEERRNRIEHENVRQLLDNMERDNRELNTLLKITSSFTVTGDSKKELLNRLTEVAAESMNCEVASIMLVNERQKALEFVVATGEKKTRLETMSIPISEGIAGWVAMNGKPQIVNDTSKDSRFTGKVDAESGFETRQILAVPLVLESRIIGVLEVINSRDNRTLNDEDIRILSDIGGRAATVIEATRTIEDQQNFYVQTTNIIVKAVERKDLFSIGHPWQVAEICHKISLEMNLSETERSDLHFGALLHDIGKLEMPSSLFNKRSLSERELEFVRQHPVKGAKLIEPITIWKGVVPHILYHHEFWDGSGYPFGRQGQSIPLGARIINLAEAFSVMRSPNSYKRRMSIKESILEIMRMAGRQFDPDIVRVFVSVLEKDLSSR